MNNYLNLVEDMKKLGYNQYEAKAYIKLLEEWPVNGYTLSKNSGVPRSKIYEVLNNICKKQLVFEKETQNGEVYYPLEPDQLVDKLKKKHETIIENVEKETVQLFSKAKEQYSSKIITGRNNIFDFIRALVGKANERIDISIWQEEFIDLENSLEEAIKKMLKLRIYFLETIIN